MPISGPKSTRSFQAGLRASGKSSTSRIVPTRSWTRSKSDHWICCIPLCWLRRGSNVKSRGTDEPVVLPLLDHVRDPAKDARRGETRREQLLRDVERQVDDALVELEIRFQRALAVAGLRGECVVDRHQDFEQLLRLPGFRDLLCGGADDARARIDDAILAVAHAHHEPAGREA